MTRTILSLATVLSLTISGAASANDIVDFLNAVSGPQVRQHRGHDRVAVRSAVRGRSHAAHHQTHRTSSRHLSTRHATSRRSSRPVVVSRPGLRFSVSFGQPAAQRVPVYAPAPVLEAPPVPGSFGHLPHQLGEIVTCAVPLETHVRVKDVCDIAPNAVPVIVAVRNPHLGRFRSRGCVESLVYVEVLAPQCPLRSARVSPCRTRIRLDYGKYEVNITSRNDCVLVDYDD